METLTKKVILETLAASEDYTTQLENLLINVTDAEAQIRLSALSASDQVEVIFQTLEEGILKALKTRKAQLLSTIHSLEQESYTPLTLCKQTIISKLKDNNLLIKSAMTVLDSGGFKSEEMSNDFNDRSSLIGILPEVPELDLVPNITFNACNVGYNQTIINYIEGVGRVFKIGPVQITSIEPHPGALLVKWEVVDLENAADILSYDLQKKHGSPNSANLLGIDFGMVDDIYTGPETECLVRDIMPYQQYTFQVRCRVNAETKWSPWSKPKEAMTKLLPFSWSYGNVGFSILNEGREAIFRDSKSILYSNGSTVSNGHSVQFTLMSGVKTNDQEGIGLTISNKLPENTLQQVGAVFVTFNGEIYMDGIKKLISFPKIKKNCKVVFSCEKLQGRWRINIESNNSCVTYEWPHEVERLFFAAALLSKNVSVLVQ